MKNKKEENKIPKERFSRNTYEAADEYGIHLGLDETNKDSNKIAKLIRKGIRKRGSFSASKFR